MWEVGPESGVTEGTRDLVADYIPGQIWGLGMNCARARCPETRAFAAHVLLGRLGCGTSEWETQAGLVLKCIISSYIWDNVLGLRRWSQRSAGSDGNYVPLRGLAMFPKCAPVL